MNLILFDKKELGRPLPYSDPRSIHIAEVLRLDEGDDFAAGLIGGLRGRARLVARDAGGWIWEFLTLKEGPPLHPLTIIIGCPRPPVARRLLKDLSTLGVQEIRICATDLNEKSYLSSKLWQEGRWRRAIVEGAVQASATQVPQVRRYAGLQKALSSLPSGEGVARVALDGDGCSSLPPLPPCRRGIVAVGPERGWSDGERRILTDAGFDLVRLGARILRTETACSIGAALMLSAMGCLGKD